MNVPTYLPPDLPDGIPYDLWLMSLEHGLARHMLGWRLEGIPDTDVIFYALMMVEKTCALAAGNYQFWLEIQFGRDLPNMYNHIVRRAAAWIIIDLSSLSPARPRDLSAHPIERRSTAPLKSIRPVNK